MKATSESTRNNIIEAKQRGEKRETIARWLSISISTVDVVWKRYKETGSYLAIPYMGRKSKISKEQELEIMEAIRETPDITLDELIEKLSIPLTISGLWRMLKRMGYSYKKKHYILKHKIVPMCKKAVKNGKKIKEK